MASRAETLANRLSLTTSASEGMLSPHPGACRPSRDWAKAFAALQASIVLHRRNHAAATPPLRWTGQQGTEQSPPTICPQPRQPKPPRLCHPRGELGAGPLFRPPCCCQRHPSNSAVPSLLTADTSVVSMASLCTTKRGQAICHDFQASAVHDVKHR